jgi:hypothetical protein
MASHLDVHLGLYNRAVATNLRAIDADAVYEAWRGSRTYYHTYRLHCHSQLAWCAGFAGSSQVALQSAEDILATTPLATVPDAQFDYTEPLGAVVWSAMVRFGMWSAILARPEPQMAPHKEPEGCVSAGDSSSSSSMGADGDHSGRRADRVSNGGGVQLDGEGGIAVGAGDDASVVDPAADAARVDRTSCVSVAMARWAKAVAAAALGNIDLAEQLRQAFHDAKDVVPASRHVHVVPSSLTLAIAATMLDGELSYRKAAAMRRNVPGPDGEDPFAESFSLLRAAVALDEALPYDEPWAWSTPVAHALGALLLEQDRTAEAEAVYRRDLERWPENMYALQGLAQCLRRSATSTASSQVDDCCSAGGDSSGDSKGGAHATRCSSTDATTAELYDVDSRLKIASDGADIVLAHSCFCAGLAGGDL